MKKIIDNLHIHTHENEARKYELNIHEIKRKIAELSIERWGKNLAIHIIGHDIKFLNIIEKAEKISNTKRPILVYGESGTGKEIIARTLFLLSKRNDKQFNVINCAQFHDENMLVSELFGHKKGSFTGAIADHLGVFETANGGVVFLDEIGELSLKVQSMLLRVIEQKEIRPVGASQPISIDIHFIMATHKDLQAMVRDGKFREDLYHRFCCHQIHIPALRKRGKDVELLADYFLQRINQEHGILKNLSEESINFLNNYSFPGNIRELQNIIECGWWNSADSVINFCDFEKIVIKQSETNDPNEIMSLYHCMIVDKRNFWEVIKKPYLQRDLNRKQVKAVISLGFKSAGNYKALCTFFNLKNVEYRAFMNFLHKNALI